MITVFHGLNADGVGYWIAVLVRTPQGQKSKISEVRHLAHDRSLQLNSTIMEALRDCGCEYRWVLDRSKDVQAAESTIKSSIPKIFGRFA